MIKLLIVEDNLVVAELIGDLLEANGYEVSGIARTVSEAVRLCRAHDPDHAIVDLHLADALPGTALISQLGAPTCMGILFASDNVFDTPLTRAHGTAFIRKPFRAEDLLDALKIVIEICENGLSLLPLPPGFRLLGLPGA
ncbi:response regulator [Lichenicola sp.]|uniref:response regulator n=1 Tax=Lichenicola sp. TaxID=2804529 RepID=UPI003B0088F2